jgi:hypothetical protein
MSKIPAFCGAALFCLALNNSYGQSVDSVANKAINFPSRLLGRLQNKINNLNGDLTRQTERYLQKMQRQEQRMQQKLSGVDSPGAQRLFGGTAQQYAVFEEKLRTDTGGPGKSYAGVYAPYLDSLQGAMGYLGQKGQVQTFEAKLMDADAAKAFVSQRQQLIAQYLTQHSNLQGLLAKPLAGFNQQVYYYSQQLRQYKEMWSNPDQLEAKALVLLNRLPAFQSFMAKNSFLSGLFKVPGNYGSPQALSGLQTKDQVAKQVQSQVSAGGAGGQAGLQSSLQSAESQLDNYKSKLSALGVGNGDMATPNFTPNDQKTKTFWGRLQLGTDFQTTRNGYYFPTVTDFGLSIGYKLGHNNIIGVGASYKLGWGNGIQHIAFSSQGIGLRSFVQIRIKGSFSASGGFEYNYTTPFISYQQLKQIEYWTKSGLIGVTKTISLKNRFFKGTTLSLLWDFLSYQQVPQTQPFVFRIGYTF